MAARTRRIVATAALSVALIAGLAPQAYANPDALKAAKERVAQLQADSAHIDQDLLEAKGKLEKAQASLKSRKSDEAGQEEKVEKLKAQLRQFALAQYQDRSFDPGTRILFSSDSDSFVSRFATVQHVADSRSELLQDYQAKEASLAAMKRQSEADVATIEEQTREIDKLVKDSDRKLAEAQGVLDKLTAEERQRLLDEQRKEQEAARAQAPQVNPAADNEPGGDDSGSTTGDKADDKAGGGKKTQSDPTAGIPDGDRVAKVIATAKSQLGDPYRRGAAGPDYYDCSGLTLYSFKAAGVSLPRVSRQQVTVGRRVSYSEMKPGDLVFYYSPIRHVAIYIGNGQIIHSPRPGKTVEIVKASTMPFNSATRVL